MEIRGASKAEESREQVLERTRLEREQRRRQKLEQKSALTIQVFQLARISRFSHLRMHTESVVPTTATTLPPPHRHLGEAGDQGGTQSESCSKNGRPPMEGTVKGRTCK